MQRLAASTTLGRLRAAAGPSFPCLSSVSPLLVSASSIRGFASGHDHHDDTPPGEKNIPKQTEDYRPGSDSFAYENPWPKLNSGRLDWLFQEGWRRPLAKDQGGKVRREWIWFGQVPHDEHKDWLKHHQLSFLIVTVLTAWMTIWLCMLKSDEPVLREWALREAHLELIRREKAGLPYISPDLVPKDRVLACLPSEEELRDFEILI
ncbi:hypothetical protein WR25_06523 [Diploscapter pachys]|uniref:NADH dehydrogenase [ubiquinone] 1 beta subcomplex subunit 11, mitochondrial n=1 Tax=Diploscapter pachys TaxID=2018661 RepID=A0A2A2KMJ0_9BILA|nr:hypothetical protein WR25_06523 [Diploscapter pachys]